ncbi:D-isomer specific 2-hydroxyacid dehydrogenase family protein [Naasia sp. SYSU D00948]|uniref:D-isomer specific 2-hydroxyacid dehydrogenase family protein n=1 Tax=Naasia sp. SYSU D00948 TaxID=2817379 RepID=UPI001B308DD5|nr:D-isomer specific 2-hydroxyacid dehydrogenase family protein [Naasia sp. SYSU D00948]
MTERFRHRAVAGAGAAELPPDARPQAGPIAVLPESDAGEVFLDAVRSAGGEPAPLGSSTRGIVWLGPSDPDGLLEALERSPGVQWVQLPWAGVDAFAQALADHDRDDLVWTSAKGAYAQPVAEHALTLTLAGLRSLTERARATSWGPKTGESLYGKTVVVVGAGGIAVELIRLMAPFDVRTIVVRRSAGEVEGAERTVTSERLAEVLPEADVLVLAAASTAETRHLIGERELAAMKPTAVLVNVARGALVDTDALVAALRGERLHFAGLDVTDPEPLPDGHPLWSEPRALITPHSADTPEMIEPLLAERVRLNVEAFVSTGRFVGVVDPRAGY